MTSIEALDKLNDKYIHSNRTDDEANKELQIIEKDLTVLEILREYVYLDKKDNLVKMSTIAKQWENFDFEIIKEWLKQ